VPSRELVDEFWRVGTGVGYTDDGAPGLRPQYSPDYYGAFLLDPDGNSAEAVHHGLPRSGIDHLWIRVTDVEAAKRFYETMSPYSGFALRGEKEGRAHFGGRDGSFTLVPGEPTEHVHIAFPAGENAAVDAFHRTAVEAGYRDHGAPGERPAYHAGYCAAYVLDPDGNSAEAVHHGSPRSGIDHLWTRVADVEAAKRFYETVSPYTGFALRRDGHRYACLSRRGRRVRSPGRWMPRRPERRRDHHPRHLAEDATGEAVGGARGEPVELCGRPDTELAMQVCVTAACSCLRKR
jgi:catechol 2,3-dioxygenase-like lactoylglutathione lyase family enzyme